MVDENPNSGYGYDCCEYAHTFAEEHVPEVTVSLDRAGHPPTWLSARRALVRRTSLAQYPIHFESSLGPLLFAAIVLVVVRAAKPAMPSQAQ